MDLLFFIISLILIAIGLAVNSLMAPQTTSISTYKDNGKRLKIKINTMPEISQTENCNIESLTICDVNDKFSCGKCKEPLATCHHISNDMTLQIQGSKEVFIKANTNKNEGYCLSLNSSGSARTCTRKNGGKWIMTLNPSQTLYKFECFCSQHNYFVNSPIDNDCTQFVGCVNGQIKNNDWKSVDEIDCECNINYESTRTSHQKSSISDAPQCILKNIFKWKTPPFPVLDRKYIDPLYLNLITSEIKVPNPCLYDLATNTFIDDIGEIVIDPKTNIAFCRALKVGYTSVITNSDYLLNNNGNYSNSITSFTNNVQDLIKRHDETVYEYQRTKIDTPDNVLHGVRVYYNNFKFKLSYLEPDSGNMNGPGVLFNFAPRIPKDRINFVYVYVYNAPTPAPVDLKDMPMGKMLYWAPFFNTQGGINSSNRVYNGIMPLRGGAIAYMQKIFFPLPPVPNSCKKLAGFDGLYPVNGSLNAEEDKWAIDYALPLNVGNNFKSRINTGAILNYHIKDVLYTKPLSCDSLDLTQKYRKNFNPNFSVLYGAHYTYWMYYVNNCENEYLANKSDEHMWPETCYGLEKNGIGSAEAHIGRYKVENNEVKFCEFYS